MPRLLQGLVCLFVLAALAACGFQPLYGTSALNSASVSARLASVAVPEQTSRVGQLIRNEILAAISPAGTSAAVAYRLDMTAKSSDDTAVEAQNSDVLRRSYRLNVDFVLVESASGKQVYTGKTFSYVSYDRTGTATNTDGDLLGRTPFANQQARANAEERAAREAGLDIRTRLAAYFATN